MPKTAPFVLQKLDKRIQRFFTDDGKSETSFGRITIGPQGGTSAEKTPVEAITPHLKTLEPLFECDEKKSLGDLTKYLNGLYSGKKRLLHLNPGPTETVVAIAAAIPLLNRITPSPKDPPPKEQIDGIAAIIFSEIQLDHLKTLANFPEDAKDASKPKYGFLKRLLDKSNCSNVDTKSLDSHEKFQECFRVLTNIDSKPADVEAQLSSLSLLTGTTQTIFDKEYDTHTIRIILDNHYAYLKTKVKENLGDAIYKLVADSKNENLIKEKFITVFPDRIRALIDAIDEIKADPEKTVPFLKNIGIAEATPKPSTTLKPPIVSSGSVSDVAIEPVVGLVDSKHSIRPGAGAAAAASPDSSTEGAKKSSSAAVQEVMEHQKKLKELEAKKAALKKAEEKYAGVIKNAQQSHLVTLANILEKHKDQLAHRFKTTTSMLYLQQQFRDLPEPPDFKTILDTILEPVAADKKDEKGDVRSDLEKAFKTAVISLKGEARYTSALTTPENKQLLTSFPFLEKWLLHPKTIQYFGEYYGTTNKDSKALPDFPNNLTSFRNALTQLDWVGNVPACAADELKMTSACFETGLYNFLEEKESLSAAQNYLMFLSHLSRENIPALISLFSDEEAMNKFLETAPTVSATELINKLEDAVIKGKRSIREILTEELPKKVIDHFSGATATSLSHHLKARFVEHKIAEAFHCAEPLDIRHDLVKIFERNSQLTVNEVIVRLTYPDKKDFDRETASFGLQDTTLRKLHQVREHERTRREWIRKIHNNEIVNKLFKRGDRLFSGEVKASALEKRITDFNNLLFRLNAKLGPKETININIAVQKLFKSLEDEKYNPIYVPMTTPAHKELKKIPSTTGGGIKIIETDIDQKISNEDQTHIAQLYQYFAPKRDDKPFDLKTDETSDRFKTIRNHLLAQGLRLKPMPAAVSAVGTDEEKISLEDLDSRKPTHVDMLAARTKFLTTDYFTKKDYDHFIQDLRAILDHVDNVDEFPAERIFPAAEFYKFCGIEIKNAPSESKTMENYFASMDGAVEHHDTVLRRAKTIIDADHKKIFDTAIVTAADEIKARHQQKTRPELEREFHSLNAALSELRAISGSPAITAETKKSSIKAKRAFQSLEKLKSEKRPIEHEMKIAIEGRINLLTPSFDHLKHLIEQDRIRKKRDQRVNSADLEKTQAEESKQHRLRLIDQLFEQTKPTPAAPKLADIKPPATLEQCDRMFEEIQQWLDEKLLSLPDIKILQEVKTDSKDEKEKLEQRLKATLEEERKNFSDTIGAEIQQTIRNAASILKDKPGITDDAKNVIDAKLNGKSSLLVEDALEFLKARDILRRTDYKASTSLGEFFDPDHKGTAPAAITTSISEFVKFDYQETTPQPPPNNFILIRDRIKIEATRDLDTEIKAKTTFVAKNTSRINAEYDLDVKTHVTDPMNEVKELQTALLTSPNRKQNLQLLMNCVERMLDPKKLTPEGLSETALEARLKELSNAIDKDMAARSMTHVDNADATKVPFAARTLNQHAAIFRQNQYLLYKKLIALYPNFGKISDQINSHAAVLIDAMQKQVDRYQELFDQMDAIAREILKPGSAAQETILQGNRDEHIAALLQQQEFALAAQRAAEAKRTGAIIETSTTSGSASAVAAAAAAAPSTEVRISDAKTAASSFFDAKAKTHVTVISVAEEKTLPHILLKVLQTLPPDSKKCFVNLDELDSNPKLKEEFLGVLSTFIDSIKFRKLLFTRDTFLELAKILQEQNIIHADVRSINPFGHSLNDIASNMTQTYHAQQSFPKNPTIPNRAIMADCKALVVKSVHSTIAQMASHSGLDAKTIAQRTQIKIPNNAWCPEFVMGIKIIAKALGMKSVINSSGWEVGEPSAEILRKAKEGMPDIFEDIAPATTEKQDTQAQRALEDATRHSHQHTHFRSGGK